MGKKQVKIDIYVRGFQKNMQERTAQCVEASKIQKKNKVSSAKTN